MNTMPKKTLKKWLEALRSGDYRQTSTGTLCAIDRKGPKFCCLGVLEHVLTGGVETESGGKYFRQYPTKEWLEENKISFTNSNGHAINDPIVEYDGREVNISQINDNGSKFVTIANIIEKQFVGI